MFCFCFFAFIAFPEREDAIFANENKNNIIVETSGSLNLYNYEKEQCFSTFGNETLYSDAKLDWCSTISDNDKKNYIQYSIKNKKMNINKFSVRNGCCYFFSHCDDTGKKISNNGCCCQLYSYSLRGSNDKRTWTTVHRVIKDEYFDWCQSKTFELKSPVSYKYYRFVIDEEYPHCLKCLQLNQIEFYGKTIDTPDNDEDFNDSDDDDSISIIGRVSKNDE